MATKTEGITLLPYRERVKLVRDRLSSLRQPKHVDLPKSKRVLAAEAVMSDYHERNQAHRDAQWNAWRLKRHEVEDALIVGDTAKALALLQKFGA